MAWYWITLIIIGYLLIGGLIAAGTDYFGSIEDGMAIALVLFWPIISVVFLVVAILWGFKDLAKWVFFGIANGLEDLIDDIKNNIKYKKAIKASRSKSQNEEEPSSVYDDIDYVRRS